MSQLMPDLTNIQPFEADYSQRIDSDTLDPVVINDSGGSQSGGFCRFTLTNKGFLSHDSRIVLGLLDNGNGADVAFLAPHIGVKQLIHSCVLKIGAKVVSEIRDFASLSAYESLFSSPAENLDRNQYINGQIYNVSQVNDYTQLDPTIGQKRASTLSLNNGMCLLTSNITDKTADANNPLPNNQKGGDIQSIRPQQSSQANSLFSLRLSELFPFFASDKQFPLVLMDEQINIEIHFNAYPFNCCRGTKGETAASLAREFKVNTKEVKLMADYVFFDAETMAQYIAENKNKEFRWNYLDYRLSQQVIPAEGGDGTISKNIRNIGGAGLIVNKVIMGLEDTSTMEPDGGAGADDDVKAVAKYWLSTLNLLNRFKGVRTLSSDVSKSRFAWNVRYNDRYLYPIDRENDSLLMNDIYLAENKPFRVCKDHYSKQSKTTRESNWINVMNVEHNMLEGQLFWTTAKLDGRRINMNGIDIEFLNTSVDDNDYNNAKFDSKTKVFTQNVFLEIERYAVLKDGIVDCYYE